MAIPHTCGYVAGVCGRRRMMIYSVAALATIALVTIVGGWLGTLLDPMAPAGGRVFGPPAIPDFAGRDQDGNAITERDLRGHVVVGDFIFTRCQGVCPALTARMIALQHALSTKKTRFISFSLDPDYDTPAVLKAYAARWKADPSRWRLVTMDIETLGSMLAASDSASTRGSPLDGEAHTTRFFLADARGLILGTYDGENAEAMRRLIADAAALMND
jgi:protein SCO1/2